MPVYEDDNTTVEKLYELRKKNRCKECGGMLNVFLGEEGIAYLACNDWHRTHHDGIVREASQYEPNIPTRRKEMENQHGEATTRALAKYTGVVSLTKPQATEILTLVYPNAPKPEMMRAVALCASYGLNPLMGHVFLIPFKDKWATVIGIKAKRLLASRRGSFSYVGDTPRVMTEKEQIAIFGEPNEKYLTVITKLRDPATGAEAVGYGTWPKATEPYGTDKGNSKFNMAAIRSESQALDRLRPGEMPMGVDVMPEEAIDGEFTVVEEPKPTPQPEPEPEPEVEHEHGEPEVVQEDLEFDQTWLTASLKEVKWSEATVKSYLKNIYSIATDGSVIDVVTRLNREQREQFFNEIQKRLDQIPSGKLL